MITATAETPVETKTNPNASQSTEAVRRAYRLEACLVVDEQRRIVSAAPDSLSPVMNALAEVAPTLALLPECRSLHTDYLRRTRPELADDGVCAKMFNVAGKRFFVCALGPEAQRNEAAILETLLRSTP